MLDLETADWYIGIKFPEISGKIRINFRKFYTGGNFWKFPNYLQLCSHCQRDKIRQFCRVSNCVHTEDADKTKLGRDAGFYPGMLFFWGGGELPPKTCNSPSPKNFCHVGNYNLNVEGEK